MELKNKPLKIFNVCKLSLADIKTVKEKAVNMLLMYFFMKTYTYKYTHNQKKGGAVA